MARPSDDDRAEANRLVLSTLARGDDLDAIFDAVADLHVRYDTFPGDEFMRLAADALISLKEDRMKGFMRQRGASWELRVCTGRDPVTGEKRYATKTVRVGSAKRSRRWRR